MTGLCAASKLDSKHIAQHEMLDLHNYAVMAGSVSHFDFAGRIWTMHNDQHACPHDIVHDINFALVKSALQHHSKDLEITRL